MVVCEGMEEKTDVLRVQSDFEHYLESLCSR